MMVLGMILAMIVAGCAEYGARTNMKNFASFFFQFERIKTVVA